MLPSAPISSPDLPLFLVLEQVTKQQWGRGHALCQEQSSPDYSIILSALSFTQKWKKY